MNGFGVHVLLEFHAGWNHDALPGASALCLRVGGCNAHGYFVDTLARLIQ